MQAKFAAVIALSVLTAAAVYAPVAAQQHDRAFHRGAETRIVIEDAGQLLVHRYSVTHSALELLTEAHPFARLAEQLREDIRSDLERYDIRDEATLKRFHRTLGLMALLDGQDGVASEHLGRLQELESKRGPKATTALWERALVAARRQGHGQLLESFRQALIQDIAAMPPPVVQADLRRIKGEYEIFTRHVILGLVQTQIEPVLRAGPVSQEVAGQLVEARALADLFEPLRATAIAVIDSVVTAGTVQRPDIWAARDLGLDDEPALTPVTVAIWDSGVDVQVFPGQLHVNPDEVPGNGVDDDGNGFVDDVHGIAYSGDFEPTHQLLFETTLERPERDQLLRFLKAVTDAQAGVDSPEASEFKGWLSTLPANEFRRFVEGFGQIGLYAHGTHVSGIAARGNPAARLLVARRPFEYTDPPTPATIERARRQAEMFRATVDYFKAQGVRVVNVSWIVDPRVIEANLERNSVGDGPSARRALAGEIFDILAGELRAALEAAPQILFVAGAGNADADNRFGRIVPAAFDLPNLITVGAVDQAGDEVQFTSYGKVDVYANGYEVESVLPGGATERLSGTSMAAPQVTNLAVKLLAMWPETEVGHLRSAIVDAADEVAIGSGRVIRLLNPAAAARLLQERRGGAGL